MRCRRDCGLACALMVLRAAGVRLQDLQALRELCPTTRRAPGACDAAHAMHAQQCEWALHTS